MISEQSSHHVSRTISEVQINRDRINRNHQLQNIECHEILYALLFINVRLSISLMFTRNAMLLSCSRLEHSRNRHFISTISLNCHAKYSFDIQRKCDFYFRFIFYPVVIIHSWTKYTTFHKFLFQFCRIDSVYRRPGQEHF